MSTYEPDGYTMGSGVWGVDAQYVTSNDALSGDGYIEFVDSTPAADPYMVSEWIPTLEGSPLLVEAVVAADSNGAGETLFVTIEWGDGDTNSLSTKNVFNGVVTTVDTWEHKSAVFTAPTSTRFFRLLFGKNNVAFLGWVDSVNVTDFPVSFKAKPSSDQSIATSAPTDVSLGTEVYDHGGVFGSSVFVAPFSGIFIFSFNVLLTGTTVDEAYTAFLWKNGTTVEAYGWSEGIGSGMALVTGSFPVLLAAGDTVGLRVNGESDSSYSVYADSTFFSGSVLR